MITVSVIRLLSWEDQQVSDRPQTKIEVLHSGQQPSVPLAIPSFVLFSSAPSILMQPKMQAKAPSALLKPLTSDTYGLKWLVLTALSGSALWIQPPDIQQIVLLSSLVLAITTAIAVWLSRRMVPPLRLSGVSPTSRQPSLYPSVEADQMPEFLTLTTKAHPSPQAGQQACITLEEYSQLLEQKVYERTQALEAEIQRRTAIEAVLYKANQELERLAFIDGLTQVANRRHFDDRLNQEWWRLKREKAPLSIILCDIDYFKQYNDTYGHQVGDDCLRKVAFTLQSVVKRPADIVARYGGEEFAIVLPDTPAAGAMHIAQAIQLAMKQLKLPHQGSPTAAFVTLSLGIASMVPQVASSPQQLILNADRALYRAKAKGRNSIVIDHLKLESSHRRFA